MLNTLQGFVQKVMADGMIQFGNNDYLYHSFILISNLKFIVKVE